MITKSEQKKTVNEDKMNNELVPNVNQESKNDVSS